MGFFRRRTQAERLQRAERRLAATRREHFIARRQAEERRLRRESRALRSPSLLGGLARGFGVAARRGGRLAAREVRRRTRKRPRSIADLLTGA